MSTRLVAATTVARPAACRGSDADWSGDGVNVSFSKPAVGSSLRIFVTDTRTERRDS